MSSNSRKQSRKNYREICQKYLFLFSLGLLLLLPTTSGCGWISGWFSQEPKQENTADPQSGTVETAEPEEEGTDTTPSRRKLGDPEPGESVLPIPQDEEPAVPSQKTDSQPIPTEGLTPPAPKEEPKPPVAPKSAPEEAIPVEPEPAQQSTEGLTPPAHSPVLPTPVQPVPAPVPPAPEETPAVPVQTDDPVDQTSPVDTTAPVNTESPINTESPVQTGGFSFFVLRLIPIAFLQDDESQDAPELEEEAQEEDLEEPQTEESEQLEQPEPEAMEQAEQPALPQTEGLTPPARSQTPPPAQTQVSPSAQPQVSPPAPSQVPDTAQAQMPPRSDRSGQYDRSRDERSRGERPRDDRSRGYERSERPAPPENRGLTPSAQIPEASVVRQPRTEAAKSIRFNFRYAPWKDVIEWFADQTALSVQADKMPTGTLNLTDGQTYTPTEGLDILNSYLLFKDYALVRKGQSLFLIYLPDTIPANLLEPITAEELDSRGKYEICKCVFDLNRTTPEIIQAEAEKMLGPQGSIVILPKSQQIVITETGGTLRTIRDIIRRIDDPDGVSMGTIHMVEMKNLTAEEALQMMRTLLAIDVADPSLRTAADASGKKILLSGRGDMIERAKEVIGRIDDSFGSDDPTMVGQPQYEVYDVGVADPTTVFSVLQTLLAGTADTRLSLDPRTGGVSLRGRPAAHATVKEAIRQMQLNVPQIDIIPLKRLSPMSVVETIKKFIVTSTPGTTTMPTQSNERDRDRDRNRGGQQTISASTTGIQPPTVEADVTARQIIVRGTISQIADIRALLAKLGEDGTSSPIVNVSTVRAIPLSPTATSLVLEQLQAILPKLDPNIKVVVPTLEEKKAEPIKKDVDSLIDETFDTEPPMTMHESPLSPTFSGNFNVNGAAIFRLRSGGLTVGTCLSLAVSQSKDCGSDWTCTQNSLPSFCEGELGQEQQKTPLQRIVTNPILAQVTESANPQPEVVISVTPAGIVLSSDDPEALSKLESVIRMLSDESVLGKMELKTYNLKYSTASVISSTLQTLLGTGTPEGGVSGAGSVDLPEWETEVQGLLSAQGDVIEKTGTVTITADERLNALYIQANLVDHKTIDKLLAMLDVPNRDDILNKAKPRFVGPLQNIRAEEAKTMVETVFANRMQGSGGNNANRGTAAAGFGGNNNRGNNNNNRNQQGGNRQQGQPQMPGMAMGGGPGGPGMEMMRQVMMAQMGGGRGGNNTPREQEPPMLLGVDPATNSLIVSASEALYLEVKSFVEELDTAALQTSNVVVTASMVDISPDLMNQTLSNMFGTAVQINPIRSMQTSQNMSFGGSNSGFRMSGTSSFGGNSPFGNNNPFMNMMRSSPFGGGMFGGGNTFRPGGAATFGGANTFGGNRGGAATFGGNRTGGNTFGGNRTGTNRGR